MYVYLLRYNNYYNRINKKEANLSDYEPYQLASTDNTPNPFHCNFNPNDGISTQLIINWDGDIPDYVVCSSIGSDNKIDSRWFVIEAVRKRGKQFELSLYRDTISDFREQLNTADIFVQKGIIEDITNPLLFNPEDMSFNQIKKYTEPLYDKSRCPWIVGYIPSNVNLTESNISFGASADWIKDNKNTVVVNRFEDWRGYPYISDDTYFLDENAQIYVEYVTKATGGFFSSDTYYKTHVGYEGVWPYLQEVNLFDGTYNEVLDIPKELVKTKDSDELLEGQDIFKNAFYANSHQTDSFKAKFTNYLRNKNLDIENFIIPSDITYIYSTSDDRTFIVRKVTKDIATDFSEYVDPLSDLASSIRNNIPSRIYVGGNRFEIDFNTTELDKLDADSLYLTGYGTCFRYEAEEVSNQTIKLEFPKDDVRIHLEDQPYDMFCMPYSNDIWIDDGQNITKYTNFKDTAYNIATHISKELGGSSSSNTGIYDIQIVPYCPLQDDIYFNTTLQEYAIQVQNGTKIEVSYDNGTTYTNGGYIMWCTKSKVEFNIDYYIAPPRTAQIAKVNNMTSFYRLTTPSQSNYFDFKADMNMGLDTFRVQCYFTPFTPWFRVCPIWKEGTICADYNQVNSNDGLIISEDCSISQISDAWVNYKLNNKNYYEMFKRADTSAIINKKWAMDEAQINRVLGTIQGAANGAITGSMVGGGPVGAAIGGTVGAIASFAGGTFDLTKQNALMNEAIDLTRDNFNYQLGNIKALPLGLSRVSALAPNNSFVPLLEYWSCTYKEHVIATSKIKFNGMTIQAIDRLVNYKTTDSSYFKGQLIRINNIPDDFHVVNTISKELNQGIYFE